MFSIKYMFHMHLWLVLLLFFIGEPAFSNLPKLDSKVTIGNASAIEIDGEEIFKVCKSSTSAIMMVSKKADLENINTPSIINYTIIVKNIGSRSLNNISLASTLPDGGAGVLEGPIGDTNNDHKLDVTETWVYTSSYSVTKEDLDIGSTLTASVEVTAGKISVADTADTAVMQIPAVSQDKTASFPTVALGENPKITDPGDTITYTSVTKNSGNVTLHDVFIVNSVLPVSATRCAKTSNGDNFKNNGRDTLDHGEKVKCIFVYTLTQGDIVAGGRDNITLVKAFDPADNPVIASGAAISSLAQQRKQKSLKSDSSSL